MGRKFLISAVTMGIVIFGGILPFLGQSSRAATLLDKFRQLDKLRQQNSRPASPSTAPSPVALAAGNITVSAGRIIGPPKLRQGFLHSVSGSPSQEFIGLVKNLRPKAWRLQDGKTYEIAERIGAERYIVSLFGILESNSGKNYRELKPWENWDQYEGQVKNIVGDLQRKYPAASPKIYWDVWGEPDYLGPNGSWRGTVEQLLELYRHAYRAARSIDPRAKLIGPDFAQFREEAFVRFLDFLQQNNLQYAGISWHEFGKPHDMVRNVETIRRLLSSRPALGNPELFVDEYAGPREHLIPGEAVGWLHYFEKTNVDFAIRGCWEVEQRGGKWSDCWEGLNGLLLKDNRTPQPVYWVYRKYGELGGQRIETSSSSPGTVAIASREDREKKLRLLVGYYGGSTGDVTIAVQNFPYPARRAKVEIWKIPHLKEPSGLLEPIAVGAKEIELSGDTIRVPVAQFQSGDAYSIVIGPVS